MGCECFIVCYGLPHCGIHWLTLGELIVTRALDPPNQWMNKSQMVHISVGLVQELTSVLYWCSSVASEQYFIL